MKIKEFISKKNYHKFSLIIIIILGAILRFYNFPNRYGFDFDASRDSLAASIYSEKFTLPLIGAASSAAPFNFGPIYYWGLIIFEKMIPVYGSWIFVSFLSLLTILVAYKIGEKLEDKKLGLILAGLISISPSQVILSTTLSNPSIIPLFSSLTILFFIYYLLTKKTLYVFIFSLFLSAGITTHFQLVGFLIFPILIFIFFNRRIKNILVSCLGFLIPLIPIIIYDINNNFYNFNGLIFYLTQSKDNVYVANRWLFYARDFWPLFLKETLGLGLPIMSLLIGMLTFLFIYLFMNKKLNKTKFLLIISFVFNFILLRYFPSQKPIYYLYFLQIFIFIFLGFLIYKVILFKKFAIFGALLIFVLLFFNLTEDIEIIKSTSSNREVAQIRDEVVSEYPNESFRILSCSTNMAEGMGLSYLFKKDSLLSENGRQIVVDSSCISNEKKLDIQSIDPKELKNLQVHKTY